MLKEKKVGIPSTLWNYSQPDFYRFNSDSIWLAQKSSDHFLHINKNITKWKVLDLCCGCGIVGIEYIQNVLQKISQEDNKNLQSIDIVFLEQNTLFQQHLETNMKFILEQNYGIEISYCFHPSFITEQNAMEMASLLGPFDIVLSNPPYYSLGHGIPPQDINRQLCRFAENDWINNFSQMIRAFLHDRGIGFFLSIADLSHKNLTLLGQRGHTKMYCLGKF